MANILIRLRLVSADTNTSEIADSGQKTTLPINGLDAGAGVAVDRDENIFVADASKHVIYKYRRGAAASRIFAGAYGVSGNVDGQGSVARFNGPTSICVDKAGRLWVVDSGNNRIRRIDDNGRVFTVAAIGSVTPGAQVGGIAVDDSENIFLIVNS